MAKRIIWSIQARKDRREVLEYWAKRNGNKIYSRRLARKFREVVRYIGEHNYLGIATDDENVRVTVCEHYLLFYEIKKLVIEILTLWDSRRNPQDLKIKR